MLGTKILKIIALIRYQLRSFHFKKKGWRNFCYRNVYFKGHQRIILGLNNAFDRYSNLIVDSFSGAQSISLGDNNIISSYATIRSHGGSVKLGNGNFIGERTQIQGRGGVVIGDNTLIAANCFVSSSNHNFENPESFDYLKREVPKATFIDDFVWIGANSVIVAGVHIGHHAIVGAGSVVVKDVQCYTLVAGNPAKPIKKFDLSKKEWIKC